MKGKNRETAARKAMESALSRMSFSPDRKRSLSVEQARNRPARFGNGVTRLLCALADGTANGPGLFSQPLNALRKKKNLQYIV